MSRAAALILAFAGCDDAVRAVRCEVDDRPMLVAATTDFEAGAISAVGLEDGAVDDPLAPIGGDPLVVALDDGRVALLERGLGGQHLRLYTPGCWDAPDVEIAVDEANLHWAVLHDDELWLTAWDEGTLQVRDPGDGALLDELELGALADADGDAEPDRIVVRDGQLWVSLQRLDELAGWQDGGGGRVVVVDPGSRQIVAEHAVGANPKMFASARGLVLLTGVFGALDGAFQLLAPDGAVTDLRTEVGLGFDLQHYAEVGDVGVLVGVDTETKALSRVWCHDWVSGALTAGPVGDEWYADVAASPDGTVWIASRSGTATPGDGDGLIALDPATCAAEPPVTLLLEPFSLAVRP